MPFNRTGETSIRPIGDRGRERDMKSYITGDLPGCPGSLERDGVQPEVVATSPGLFPRVPVDFLGKENKEKSKQGVIVCLPCHWFSAGAVSKHKPLPCGCPEWQSRWAHIHPGPSPALGLMGLATKGFRSKCKLSTRPCSCGSWGLWVWPIGRILLVSEAPAPIPAVLAFTFRAGLQVCSF